MAASYKYTLSAYGTRLTTQYGAIKTFISPMKTTVTISGYIQAQSTSGSTTGYTVTSTIALKYKLNGGTEVSLRYG